MGSETTAGESMQVIGNVSDSESSRVFRSCIYLVGRPQRTQIAKYIHSCAAMTRIQSHVKAARHPISKLMNPCQTHLSCSCLSCRRSDGEVGQGNCCCLWQRGTFVRGARCSAIAASSLPVLTPLTPTCIWAIFSSTLASYLSDITQVTRLVNDFFFPF